MKADTECLMQMTLPAFGSVSWFRSNLASELDVLDPSWRVCVSWCIRVSVYIP